MARLVKEKKGKLFYKDIKITEDPDKLKAVLNETRWEILKLISEKPLYPALIADKLDLHQQKVYYHIKQLKKADIIEVERKEEKGGSLAKFYTVKDYAFALELPFGDERLVDFPLSDSSDQFKKLIWPFVNNGRVNCNFVVGSPDPHGPHQVRGRDGHFAVDLALSFGQYGSLPEEFTTMLDVEVTAEKEFDQNLVLVGGPLTNTLTSKVNNYLPVKFEKEHFPYRELISEKTGEHYQEENTGVIAKIPNPEAEDKFILVLAGTRFSGTRAAVLALTRFQDQLLETYQGEDSWARVVLGKDMDGDGTVDAVNFLE